MVLKDIIEFLEKRDPNIVCKWGFNDSHSYRGSYESLAFEPTKNITVGEMLACAREALGSEHHGYKGGNYIMDGYTDCYLAEYGSTGEEIGKILLHYMVGDVRG